MWTNHATSQKQSPSSEPRMFSTAGPVPGSGARARRTLPTLRGTHFARAAWRVPGAPAARAHPAHRCHPPCDALRIPLVSSEVGIDIIETVRIRNVLERHPRRFLDRVYTEWEQMYCRTNILHLSGRWAAKEAVSKVLGLGVRGVGWREIEIRRTRAGQPTVTLHGRAEARREAIGLKTPLSVSISHIRDLAVAVAVGLR